MAIVLSEQGYPQKFMTRCWARQPWVNSAFVVNDWYKTAYEPIKNINGQIIGMLYVGTLKLPLTIIARNTMLIFLAIILAGNWCGRGAVFCSCWPHFQASYSICSMLLQSFLPANLGTLSIAKPA